MKAVKVPEDLISNIDTAVEPPGAFVYFPLFLHFPLITALRDL